MAFQPNRKVIFVVLAAINWCLASCIGLIAPFFPEVASSKGISSTEYSFAVGVHFLTLFVASPLYGTYIDTLGCKRLTFFGAIVAGISYISFGCLIFVEDDLIFYALTIFFRIMEGVGAAAFTTATFTIIVQEFEDHVGKALTSLESAFALGLIIGPVLGGALYEWGGFILPFALLGSLLILSAGLAYCVLFSKEFVVTKKEGSQGVLEALKLPKVTANLLTVFIATNSYGFISVCLEPYFRFLKLSHFHLGLVFVIIGISQAIITPLAGKIYDLGISYNVIISFGICLEGLSFIILGPAPFIAFEPSLTSLCVFLAIHGAAFGIELMIPFAAAQREAIEAGFDNDLSTYGIISGLWSSSFALGAFVGPLVSGSLMDVYGFKIASLYIIVIQAFALLMHVLLYLQKQVFYKTCIFKQSESSENYTELN